MKNKYYNILSGGLFGLAIGFSLVACNDVWDEHFDQNGGVASADLMSLMKSDNQLGRFCQILEKTGCDSLLNTSQTYTVWAPVDEALADVDLNDMDAMRRIALNHIARYLNPTSTETDKRIKMLNGKSMSYTSGDEFNGVRVVSDNIRGLNGLLHKLDTQIPYRYNLREYISTQDKYSKLYDFISTYDEKIYDEELSTTYDSIFMDYNRLLEDPIYGIGSIGDEDSVYTMILPDNAAWDAAYEHISPYFKVYNKSQEYADSVQAVQTGLAILSGLTFRDKYTNPSEEDSMVTVTSHVIRKTADYFNGYASEEASNGMIFKADGNLNYDDTCVWNLPIEVEAENMDTRVSLTGTNAYIRNTDVNSLVSKVSNSSYLEVVGSSVNPGVVFDVMNVLSGKYDIYVDFVPPIIDGESMAMEKTRVMFQLKYRTATGGNKTLTNRSSDLIVGGTGTNEIITVKAWEGVEFPISNYYDALWFLDENHSLADATVTTTLQIQANVNSSELNKELVRKFRVDRIRFVPVK